MIIVFNTGVHKMVRKGQNENGAIKFKLRGFYLNGDAYCSPAGFQHVSVMILVTYSGTLAS